MDTSGINFHLIELITIICQHFPTERISLNVFNLFMAAACLHVPDTKIDWKQIDLQKVIRL